MVRVNLINPKFLSDQHLIAEYNEILMLVSYIKKHQKIKEQPKEYVLGRGHMLFFKNKLLYLKKRHELLKEEMRKRGFKTEKTISLEDFDDNLKKDYKPDKKAISKIKERLIYKLKLKKDFYRYYREKKNQKFFIEMIKKAK